MLALLQKIVLLLLTAAVPFGLVAAQQPGPPFRSSVQAILLDVSVLDDERRSVLGLMASDFTVLEDGRQQSIQTFTAVGIPADTAPEMASWTRDVVSDVRANKDLLERRIIVLVLDDSTPMPAADVPRVKELARRVIRSLGPTDVAALVFTMNQSAGREFTDDRASLLAAVDAFNGSLDKGVGLNANGMAGETPFDQFTASAGTLYQSTVTTLRTVTERLAELPHRRKAVVFVSVGLPLDIDMTAVGQIGTSTGDAAGVARRLIEEIQECFRAAQRANVNIYSVDAGALRAPDPRISGTSLKQVTSNPGQLNRDFFRTLSANTGGFVVTDTNSPDEAISQLLRENGHYYLIGYTPTNRSRDGRFRRIQIRVNRPGVTVRTRSGYFGPEARQGAGDVESAVEPRPLSAALGGILPRQEIALQVTAAAFASADHNEADVAIVVGVRQPAVAQGATAIDDIECMVVAYDRSGKSRAVDHFRLRIRLRAGDADDVRYEALSRLRLPAGRYQLRIGVRSSLSATLGSVYYDVDVPDFSRTQLSTSGVVLAVTPAMLAAPSGRLSSVLPLVPTTERLFVQSDRITAFFRVYRDRIAGNLTLTARILDSNDVTRFQKVDTFDSAAFRQERSLDYVLPLSLAKLASGPYLLRIDASIGDRHIRREIRFRVR